MCSETPAMWNLHSEEETWMGGTTRWKETYIAVPLKRLEQSSNQKESILIPLVLAALHWLDLSTHTHSFGPYSCAQHSYTPWSPRDGHRIRSFCYYSLLFSYFHSFLPLKLARSALMSQPQTMNTHAPPTSRVATALAVVKVATVAMAQHTAARAACPTATQLLLVGNMRKPLAKAVL